MRAASLTVAAVLAAVAAVATAAGLAEPAHAVWHHAPAFDEGRPATGSGAAAPAPQDSPRLAAALARLPHFGQAPPAPPVALAPGPAAAWLSAVPTTQRVAFVTIDDGWTKSPDALALLRAARVPVTMFLEINAIRSDPGYFTGLETAGASIEAHTITHPDLRGRSYAAQRQEICGSADQLTRLYGQRPWLFRPPYGDKDATTLTVVHDCGMRAALFWKETVDKGVVRYQAGHVVRPGDILLMHFRPAFDEDFVAALQAIAAAGLVPARLEDYLG